MHHQTPCRPNTAGPGPTRCAHALCPRRQSTEQGDQAVPPRRLRQPRAALARHPPVGQAARSSQTRQAHTRHGRAPSRPSPLFERIRLQSNDPSAAAAPRPRPHTYCPGLLGKLGGFMGGSSNWKQRWFVLYDSSLKYFKDREARGPAMLPPLPARASCGGHIRAHSAGPRAA